jgi:hypothetical protein
MARGKKIPGQPWRCPQCKVEKLLTADYWPRDKSQQCGFAGWCLACYARYADANKERRNKQGAEYRAANKERIAKQNAEYRALNKERIAKHQAGYYVANKERITLRNAEWREANQEHLAEYRALNKEQRAALWSEWYAANKERCAERNRVRVRAAMKNIREEARALADLLDSMPADYRRDDIIWHLFDSHMGHNLMAVDGRLEEIMSVVVDPDRREEVIASTVEALLGAA